MDCCDGHEIGSICGGHALRTSDFEKHMVVLFMLVCFTSDHVQDFNLLEATHVLSYDNHCSSWQGYRPALLRSDT